MRVYTVRVKSRMLMMEIGGTHQVACHTFRIGSQSEISYSSLVPNKPRIPFIINLHRALLGKSL